MWDKYSVDDATEKEVEDALGDVSESKSGDSSLRDWFSKSRSSDGTPGWVQLGGKYAGKPCAKQPGQTTKPKCGSSKMKRNLDKDEEQAAFRRKQRQDPNPDRKGKAINVKTEEAVIEKAGEKDACYKKVKSRYSVWPSAYASGALVKCRKVGAANWGNKTKKEEYEFYNWRDDFKATEYEFVDLIKPEPLKSEQIDEGQKCWTGYEKKGTKKMFGKTYNNCVKKEELEIEEGRTASGVRDSEAISRRKRSREEIKKKPKLRRGEMRWKNAQGEWVSNKDPRITSVFENSSDIEIPSGDIKKLAKKAIKRIDYDVDGDVDSQDKSEKKTGNYGEQLPTPYGKFRTGDSKKVKVKVKKEQFFDWRSELDEGVMPAAIDPKKHRQQQRAAKIRNLAQKGATKGEKEAAARKTKGPKMFGEDWQKVNKSDRTDGMSAAAVKAYRRENPGSKLKTAVTGDPKPGSKDAKRRKSFCARSKGQQDMHNIDCSKTPDKPVCKARRRWKC